MHILKGYVFLGRIHTSVSSGCHNEICRLSVLKNKHLFLILLEARRSKTTMWADSVSDETLFLVCRWLPFCHNLTGQKERGIWSPSSHKGTNPITRATLSLPHLNLTLSRSLHLHLHHGDKKDTNLQTTAGCVSPTVQLLLMGVCH